MIKISALTMRFLSILAIIAILLASNAAALAQTPAVPAAAPVASQASDDRFNSDPTGWLVYEHQAVADINNQISQGYRLVDLQVEAFSPSYLFTAAYVANTGSYQKSWWWYYGLDEAGVNTRLSQNNARLTSLKAYDIGGGLIRFAVVMIANTGADAAAWWWYFGKTPAEISTLLNTNQARLTQIHAYVTGGVNRYAVVMVDNTGVNNRGWWWYYNVSGPSIPTLLATNQARLIDLDPDPLTGNFNVIMVSCAAGCPYWWWYYNVPTSQILTLAAQNGARMIDVNTVPGCGDACFSFILINNSNAITSRVGEILRNGTDGVKGLYLKQVGGPVLANLMDGTAFEPASTIKAAVHLQTMRALQSGPDTLATLIPQYQPPVGSSCPGTTVIGSESIQIADREMMWHSDNTRTAELVDHYGRATINNLMTSIGMVHSSLNHVLGCGGPTPNQTTLDDLGTLYEGVANGTLLNSTYRQLFYSQMAGKAEFLGEGYDWTHLWDTDLPNMINAEAPAGMTAASKDRFRIRMDLAYKAGNYKICGTTCATYVDHISIFGVATIPFCDAGGPRQYVFGIFINNSTSDATSSSTFNTAKSELLREQLHAGLATCAFQSFIPQVTR